MKTLGVVGGAGPMAGALLLQKVIAVCQMQYGCVEDDDFPKMMLLSTPFSEMLRPHSPFQAEEAVAGQLQASLDQLLNNGAGVIGIACNTLHSFLPAPPKELISLVELTNHALERGGRSGALVLATSSSRKKGIYPSEGLSPCEQAFIDHLIRKVLSGNYSDRDGRVLEGLVLAKRVDRVVLGCSELSVLHKAYPLRLDEVDIIDPLDLLANELCRAAFDDAI